MPFATRVNAKRPSFTKIDIVVSVSRQAWAQRRRTVLSMRKWRGSMVYSQPLRADSRYTGALPAKGPAGKGFCIATQFTVGS
ncbi:MAG: hypothetical protein DCF27_02460 [Lysobacteraceae bacterium]|nr:MAG: hypothetical protein DCF27_02460 [Xanthomonadaceae bacterium]